MKEAEIAVAARQFPRLHLHKPDSYPSRLIAQQGDTQIYLDFRESLLKAYRVSWTSGFTQQDSRVKHNLCSGTKYVELNFLGRKEFAGAIVWLDGKRVTQLDMDGDFCWDVPLGIHQLRIEKPGVGTWTAELRYEETSPGHDRLPIELLTKESENK